MKILMIGAGGTIGQKVKAALSSKHEIITAGRNSGDVRVDISSPESVEELFKQVKSIDAVIVTAGSVGMDDLQTLTTAKIMEALPGKLMGQINVVLIGQHHLNEGGSFTLTSGILADDPAKGFISGAIVNAALNGFVLSAALELKKGIHINAISPGVVEDSFVELQPLFPGFNSIPMDRVVNAYVRSVEGGITGQIIKVY